MNDVVTAASSVDKTAPAGGAISAQRGFDYQLNVSILAALRLMLVTKSATRITLEPANEEDLEADLELDRPGRVQPGATLAGGYKLLVQVKLKSGEPWSLSDVRSLLEHGKDRKRATEHLADPDTRYLLVTTAAAKGRAMDLLVSDFEESPDPAAFPTSLNDILTNSPEGRVAIYGGLTEELVDYQTGEILDDLRVPRGQQPACRTALREQARLRMAGTSPGLWAREDLESTIRLHGGYFASSEQLTTFVPAANFSDMVTQLAEKNAVVISGPSGTGKTIAALALCDEARQRNGQLQMVTINASDDPARTRRSSDDAPTLFYIEDPWGQYSLRGGSEAWTDQLPRLLKAARPDHQYVITSRSDMLGQARASDALKRWSIALEPEHYQSGQLGKIYDRRMHLLPAREQAKALEFRARVLEVLETPLELDLFFTNLGYGPEDGESDPALLGRLLALSHRDAVEHIVVQYLDKIDAVGMAAVIWALLVARGQVDRTQLIALQRQLRSADQDLASGLGRMVDRLIATRHLRQPGRIISFAHPSVGAAFASFLKEDWLRNEDALRTLIDALVDLRSPHDAWGMETAAQVVSVARELATSIEETDDFEANPGAQARIDRWLEDMLTDPASDFQAVLVLAADVGSDASIPAELARWFITGVPRGANLWIDDWEPPQFDDAWYERISADERSATIAGRFVREQLPHDSSSFQRSFAEDLDRIATGLTPAFIDAAHRMIGMGFDRNLTAIAAGAVRDLDGFTGVLSEALDDLAAIRHSHETEGKNRWRKIEDGECDAAEEEWFQNVHEDDGYASGELVDTWVAAMRRAGRWADLATHPRAKEISLHWARAAGRSGEATAAEMHAIIDACGASGYEAEGWDAARSNWHAELEERLAARLTAGLSDDKLRIELAQCALVASRPALVAAAGALADRPAALVQLLVDVRSGQGLIPAKTRASVLRPLLRSVAPEFAEIFGALPGRTKAAKAVGPAAAERLEETAETAAPSCLAAIVPVLIASGRRPSAAIARWLSEADDAGLAAAATEAAIAIHAEEIVRGALQHKRADARLAAFEHLAQGAADPLEPDCLALARDPGSQVRKAVVRVLSAHPHPDHLPALLRLSQDNWSDAEPQYNEPDSYPIARDAVEGLRAYGLLADEIGDELIALARRTTDRELRQKALSVAAACCSPEVRVKIWELVADRTLNWIRVDALDALSEAPMVEMEIVELVTADRIVRRPAPIAASATVFVSQHLPVGEAGLLLEQIAHHHSHRALVVLGASVLADRDKDEAARVLALLGRDHPAARILEPEVKLPATVLDDLGDIRIRRHVQFWLSNRIAKA